jgi:hypothetical protein
MTIPTTFPMLPISRRALVGVAALAGTAFAIGGLDVLGTSNAFAAQTGDASAAAFLRLSEFVTGGKPLAAELAARYQAALSRHDAKFGDACAALQRYLAEAKPAHIDELLARPDLGEPLRKTVTDIVSAWYLGIVGTDADAELIAYADALMYRPTLDVLAIPSYGGGPDSWGAKPPATPVTLAPTPVTEKKA